MNKTAKINVPEKKDSPTLLNCMPPKVKQGYYKLSKKIARRFREERERVDSKQSIMERYKSLHTKLEIVRIESRRARCELVDAIMCDEKDVLCRSEIQAIKRALQKFLGVQKRLQVAWFKESNASARHLGTMRGVRDILPDCVLPD